MRRRHRGCRAGRLAGEATLAERDTLAQIVTRHRRSLFGLALARTGSIDAADDVVQAVLLRVVRRGGLAGVARPHAYLVAAVENLCRNRATRRRSTEPLPTDSLSAAPGPQRSVAAQELGDLLRAAIRDLPSAYSATVWLVHVEGLSVAEVATCTGRLRNSVKSSLARGRRLLRERLGPVLRRAGYLDV